MSDQDEAVAWLAALTGHAEAPPEPVTEPEPSVPRPDPSQGAAGGSPLVNPTTNFVEWLQDGPSRRAMRW